jgi:Flp pilus assembly protein TadG
MLPTEDERHRTAARAAADAVARSPVKAIHERADDIASAVLDTYQASLAAQGVTLVEVQKVAGVVRDRWGGSDGIATEYARFILEQFADGALSADAERARRMDSVALLAAVDEGASRPYRDELQRRLDLMREARENGRLDELIRERSGGTRP